MTSRTWTVLFMVASVATANAALSSCSDGGGDNAGGGGAGGGDTSFECSAAHDQWEQCADNMVQWCHGQLADPHFHWGANCADLGLQCVELSESEAACVDSASTCTPPDAKCQDGTAYNCLPEGHWTVEPCTSSCVAQDGEAQCEQLCTTTAPADACAAVSGAAKQKQVAETFNAVFAEDYHAEVGVPIAVTLPDQVVSYIHFPVIASGPFLVFADTDGVLDAILDANENDMLATDDGANSDCAADLPDQIGADLVFSGGTDPDPYVLRFKAVSTQTITFIIEQPCP